MRIPRLHIITLICAGLVFALAGCGSSTGGTSVRKTLDNPQYTDHSYNNILVIGVGGDYNNRATFERSMVSRIKAEGASATAWYSVVGRNQPINRATVSAAVKSRGFDAVLLARVISQETDVAMGQGTVETKVTRKSSDRVIDLFRYDYDELTQPGTINTSGTITIFAEMFSGPDETRMWAIESTIEERINVDQLIEEAAETIMAQLVKDELIGD